MKKDRTITKFTLILLVHILFYFFKVNPDIFASQEYHCLPQQTYTEQPLSTRSSNYYNGIFDLHPISNKKIADKNIIDQTAIWQSVFLEYNLHILKILKQQESSGIPSLTVVSFLQKQNIYHKSSEDEVLI